MANALETKLIFTEKKWGASTKVNAPSCINL